jgi:hypothetical protein
VNQGPALLIAQLIQAAMVRDLEQPGSDRHIPLEDGQRNIELEEGVLQHVKSLFAVVEKVARVAEQ